MGFFSSKPSQGGYTPKNEQEAWIAIMYAVTASDGHVSQVEVNKLNQLVEVKSLFKGHDIATYFKNVQTAIANDISCQSIVDSSVSKIADENKQTLMALLVELVLSDAIVEAGEEEIISYISQQLDIDVLTIQKMVDVMIIRNKYNMKMAD